MMKKTVKTLAYVLAIAFLLTPVVATAATLFQRQAGMKMFSGRIEAVSGGAPSSGAHLALAIGDRCMGSMIQGNEGDITGGNNVVFPVLVDAYHGGNNVWYDSTGKTALGAPVFSLFCEGGSVTNAAMRIEVDGDLSAANAVRFGVYIVHYAADHETMLQSTGASYGISPNGESEIITIGDMLEGEMVEIYIATWIMASDLDSCDYTGGEFSAEAVFSAEY